MHLGVRCHTTQAASRAPLATSTGPLFESLPPRRPAHAGDGLARLRGECASAALPDAVHLVGICIGIGPGGRLLRLRAPRISTHLPHRRGMPTLSTAAALRRRAQSQAPCQTLPSHARRPSRPRQSSMTMTRTRSALGLRTTSSSRACRGCCCLPPPPQSSPHLCRRARWQTHRAPRPRHRHRSRRSRRHQEGCLSPRRRRRRPRMPAPAPPTSRSRSRPERRTRPSTARRRRRPALRTSASPRAEREARGAR